MNSTDVYNPHIYIYNPHIYILQMSTFHKQTFCKYLPANIYPQMSTLHIYTSCQCLPATNRHCTNIYLQISTFKCLQFTHKHPNNVYISTPRHSANVCLQMFIRNRIYTWCPMNIIRNIVSFIGLFCKRDLCF